MTIFRNLAVCLFAFLFLAAAAHAQDPTPIVTLDQPFTFSYGTWQDKAKIDNGVVLLDAEGVTPQGGAGVNAVMDLSSHTDDAPAVRVTVGPKNTLKTLRLVLGDKQGRNGMWHFALPQSTGQSILLTAKDGTSFAQPNETSKEGMPDLSQLMQWQVQGDWGGSGAVDLRIEAILAVAPDAAILKEREELAVKLEAERKAAIGKRMAERTQFVSGAPGSPVIQSVYAAAPDLLAIRIREGKITPTKLQDYKAQPGDEQKRDKDGKVTLIRNRKEIGAIIGPPGKEDGLVEPEGFTGDALLTVEADDPANFTIASNNDPAYAQPITPVKVSRKSKPDDWQQFTQQGIVIEHTIYLSLPSPLVAGKTYTITLCHLNADKAEVTLDFDPAQVWTESVHVNQVGYRADDPYKRAYLSLWIGTGGGHDFADKLGFAIVEDATGKPVYTGTVGQAWSADKIEEMATHRNFNGTSVRPIDFVDFQTPGRYRVMVEGVGVSYLFNIGPDVWEKAFWVQMKGFYNQRSGVALGPPFTDFVRPVCWKPGVNNAMSITQSTYSNLDQEGTLAGGDTGKPVPQAWGGWHDAGDWNPRRITHMRTTAFWQLELLQMFPDYFKSLKLNIPDDAPGPDLLKEALFELDLFRRLQNEDGGVSFGIETDGDPHGGEVSWKQHMPAYVYAADAASTYFYAAVAARASQVLADYDKALAQTYHDSALNAMEWAEKDRAKRQAEGRYEKKISDILIPERNRAAACLLALTGDKKWDEIFLEETRLKNDYPPVYRGDDAGRDAAFVYTRLGDGVGDADMKQRARRAIIADADGSLDYQQKNAFNIASDDFGKPQFIGFYSTPHGAVSLLRAHRLTGFDKYIAGAVAAAGFPGGANPSNIVYTSGVGANSVKAMNMDAQATGQPPPIGLSAYGNVDLPKWTADGEGQWITWPITWFLGKHTQPDLYGWPTTEAYFDVRFWPALNEFTVDQTMGPNAYVWGYLTARK